MKNRLFYAVLLITTILGIYSASTLFESPVHKADRYLSKGQYQKAAEIYLAQSDLDKVRENLDSALIGWAKDLYDEDRIDEAVDRLAQVGDDSTRNREYEEIAADLLLRNNFAQAGEIYKKAGNEEQYIFAMEKLSDQKLEMNDFVGSIEVLEMLPNTNGRSERIASLWMSFADHQATSVAAYDADNGALNYDYARTLGEELYNVDAQLLYCGMLRDGGYNMAELYPNGVRVSADLSAFQIFELGEGQVDPDYSKLLVFSREEPLPDLTIYSSTTSQALETYEKKLLEEKKQPDFVYNVSLHPEYMAEFFEENQAKSMEEATAIILLEQGYLPNGMISIRSGPLSSSSSFSGYSYKYCIYCQAVQMARHSRRNSLMRPS